MVAAGATVLMAASEENSSNGTDTSTSQCENHIDTSRYNEVHCNQESAESSVKRDLMPCSSNIKDKKRNHMLEKPNRIASRTEKKDNIKNFVSQKTTPVRETKASRLRAASVISSGATLLSKRLGTSETSTAWNFQSSTNLSTKERKCAQESPLSSDSGSSSTMNSARERDKSYKRKSYLNRSLNTEATPPDRLNQSDCERRTRRQSNKQNHLSETISPSDSSTQRQFTTSLPRKHLESKLNSQKVGIQYNTSRSKPYSSPSTASITSSKYSSTRATSSNDHNDSEVSRRVDALTALTRATMERVERLTSYTINHGQRTEIHVSNTSSIGNGLHNSNNTTSTIQVAPASPRKCSILKKSSDEHPQDSSSHQHPPVSILKHKVPDSETGQVSSNVPHIPLPVTFSPSVVEPIHKRHGILKKRSSLDESEILRRRSCSPDVSFTDSNYSEFRPILKNQRRSSLDEIIKRDQSPDPQPTSILKRKSSREDDREDHQLGSPEPQGILKRKSTSSTRANSTNHHVTIATDITNSNGADILESSEVRPILKKKHSREESSGNDPPSLEPRPILKKKSSTESDEHDDKPKKTILKYTRKSSQEEYSEIDLSSPKKLSMLRNRALQCRTGGQLETDCVKPILKQSTSRDSELRVRLNFYDTTAFDDAPYIDSTDLFLRKRAQSVGHVQPSNDSKELSGVLSKRRSLESSSLSDILQEKLHSKQTFGNSPLKSEFFPSNEISVAPTIFHETFDSITADETFINKAYNKDKQVTPMSEAQEKNKSDSHTFSINKNNKKDIKSSAQMTDNKISGLDSKLPVEENQEPLDKYDNQENYTVHRSNSVSRMALHFKALQEKVNSVNVEKDNSTPRKTSHGIQRYRERKIQGSDRFNTQPVTFQEVQEAVLQNQRNATSSNTHVHLVTEDFVTPDDEFDPSKLSLADRVRLFNQKIATEGNSLAVGLSQERHQRRRPANRYKTQPITSEEVEVASRISPLNVTQFSSDADVLQESQRQFNPQMSSTSQSELPKSILKSSHMHNVSRTKSPELQGLRLIKSVLKKESEENMQTSENCDTFPRSILKVNHHSKPIETYDNRETRDVLMQSRTAAIEGKWQRDDQTEYSNDMEFNLHCASNTEDTEGILYETKQRHTVPLCKNNIPQDESCSARTNITLDDIDNVQIQNIIRRRPNEERKSVTTDETPRTSDDEASSSGGREVHNIIKNEGVFRRRQAALMKQARYTALSKSASHHALSSETGSLSASMQKHAVALPGLCRSATQTIPTVEVNDCPGMSIADRLAALQRSGNTNWKKRIVTESNNLSEMVSGTLFNKEDLTIKQGVLADCLGKLESATEGWKKRIATSDVMKFTVAGKMKVEQSENLDPGSSSPLIEVTGNITDRKKKTPRPERFKGKKGNVKDVVSTPTSPSKDSPLVMRGSFSEPTSDDSGEESKVGQNLSPTVSIPKADNETFTSFFTGISLEKCRTESLNLDESDFDKIISQSELLVKKRTIRTQKRRIMSRNPLKALAARTDLRSEYTDIRTDIAEKVMKRLNVEKLAKNSPLAIEALAGLASTEDFSAITLRNAAESNVSTNKLQPYKDLMLILIKGRRHVQVRLVEPIAKSINNGDNFVLVTKSEVYNFIGKFSNVIEKARGAEIALSIQQNKDLGCQASQVIVINEDKLTCTKNQLQNFWSLLGVDGENVEVVDGGHPDEDELYESAIIDTNMVYEIKDEELIPYEKYWGTIPKIEMLDPNKILVFDFGSEMYIWSGKGASTDKKKVATNLATELWKEGYDYNECAVCPISAASMIGRRNKSAVDVKHEKSRPEWCLLAKLTQHVETVLFREKFLDWPNVSGIIRVKNIRNKEQLDGTVTVESCDVNSMLKQNNSPVDFVLEGSHLGRGMGWYDDELMKQYVATTTSVTVWHIDEFSYTLLDDSSIGQFYSGDSYIIRWMYSITVTGRELSGLPSKHSAKGRDRSVYFIWQGRDASLNEQGAAALLTVELDNDQAPQIRVVQGHEPAAFLNLFSGNMIIHSGKKTDKNNDQSWRLYICQGTLESEVFLIEIPCSMRQLRSRGSFVLLNIKDEEIYVWYGNNVLPHIKKNALMAAKRIKENSPHETGLINKTDVEIHEIDEESEPEKFLSALGGLNRKLYISLDKDQIQDHTLRLFHLSSVSKEFKATELLCAYRADLVTPFPFLQDELYQANQPALFLLDNKNEIWIWQGWWPDTGAEDQSGSKAVRWQAERRAAMTVAMQYWQSNHPDATKYPIYLVWAGLEPLQFINLFPTWTYRDDIAELNIEDGRNPGEVLTVENELARLTQSTYPPAQLLQRPLPEGVDPTRLELYLSQQHFQELLGMSKEEFQDLPFWKQMNLKKEIGLF